MSPAGVGGVAGTMRDEVLAGLAEAQKHLSPKYFYDTRGSELFERITELPEYYLTSTERALLDRWAPEWIQEMRPSSLVELGAGSSAKTRILLDPMTRLRPGVLYVPVDVSEEFMHASADTLRAEYPELLIEPEVADLSRSLQLPGHLPRPALFALLGSTIGNFSPHQAVDLLTGVGSHMRPGDRLLLGADLRPGHGKTVQELEAAYDDAAGVTAAFNRNILAVLNRELGANFDLDGFRHLAFYRAEEHRLEMHLQSTRAQTVTFEGGAEVSFVEGETIRTEISCKYDRESVSRILEEAYLELSGWTEDPDGRYALAHARLDATHVVETPPPLRD